MYCSYTVLLQYTIPIQFIYNYAFFCTIHKQFIYNSHAIHRQLIDNSYTIHIQYTSRPSSYLKNRCHHEREILQGIRDTFESLRNVKVVYIMFTWLQ